MKIYPSNPMFGLPIFHINSVQIFGEVLAKEELEPQLIQLTVRSYIDGVEYLLFANGDYIINKLGDIQIGSPFQGDCAIRKFPNGDFLCLQSVNLLTGVVSGVISFVDEPRTISSGDVVTNFSISQSTKDDEQYIRCAFWQRPNASDVLAKKIVKGSHVTVSGVVKPGSYQKNGETFSTLDVSVNHISSSKSGVTPGFSTAVPRLGKPATPISPSPVTASASTDVDVEF